MNFAGICRPAVVPHSGATAGGRASIPVLSAFPRIAACGRNHIRSARGSEENGMEMMKIHVLERALTFACIVAALAVVLWGIKILTA